MKKKIGFIGLGIMGSRMASHIPLDQYDLYVYNRTAAKADPLKERGAVVCKTPAEVAENVEILITVLSTPEVVFDIAAGQDGFLCRMKENAIWINTTTIDKKSAIELAQLSKNNNVSYLDAPVSGSLIPAEQGELIFLLGGDNQVIAEVEPLLNFMGKKNLKVGNPGDAAAFKLVINAILGQSMVALAEGISLGRALGLQTDFLLENLFQTPVVSPVLSVKKKKIISNDFSPEFPLQWMHKDLFLAAEEAYRNNISLLQTNLCKEIFATARLSISEETDFSAVIKQYQRKK